MEAELLLADAKPESFTVQDINLAIYDECEKKNFVKLRKGNSGSCQNDTMQVNIWKQEMETIKLDFENSEWYLRCGSTTIWRYGFSNNVALYFDL